MSFELWIFLLDLLFNFLFHTFPLNLLFLEVLYRPFFNLLVIIYQNLSAVGLKPDMGLAVVVFTIALRFILLPLSLREEHTLAERQEIEENLRFFKPLKSSDPLRYKREQDKIIGRHRHIFLSEVFDVSLQIWIALMLWRIFTVGLEGADFNLLYSFVKIPTEAFNLTFLGQIDLAQPNLSMNVLNAVLLFVIETLNLEWSVIPPTQSDRWAQFIFPIGVFLYLYGMPAGKKLFIITTLLFTLSIMIFKEVRGLIGAWQSSKKKTAMAWEDKSSKK